MAASMGQWRATFNVKLALATDLNAWVDDDKTINITPNVLPNQAYGQANLYYNYDSGPVIFEITAKSGYIIDDITVPNYDYDYGTKYQLLDDNRIKVTPIIDSNDSGSIDVCVNISEPPAYLDQNGLAYLWSKIKTELNKKANK